MRECLDQNDLQGAVLLPDAGGPSLLWMAPSPGKAVLDSIRKLTKHDLMRKLSSSLYGFYFKFLVEFLVGGWFCAPCIQMLTAVPRNLVAVQLLALSNISCLRVV